MRRPPRSRERMLQPDLATERLRLRPFDRLDVETVVALAGPREVAENTLNIPHPYDRRDAEEWVASHADQLERREAVTYAVVRRDDDALLGAVGLILDPEHDRAELGYWIGPPYWGNGYATEAAAAILDWGFPTLRLHRIHASHFPRNPASGRVLRKLGMRHEGRLREHVKKWDRFLDLESYGILRPEWEARRARRVVVERPGRH